MWAKRLFELSPLKQKKWEALTKFLGDTSGQTALDLGSDNGVISLLLRERGGEWSSADLIPETVSAIRELVGERVYQIEKERLPFEKHSFDLIIIVDLLEHLSGDSEFVNELLRVLRPGGRLIVNVPNPRPGIIRLVRNLIGQDDKAHGHLRPGYSLAQLCKLFEGRFVIRNSYSYVGPFSETIDTAITFGLTLLKGKRGKKGTVFTATDSAKLNKSLRFYSAIYPLVALFVKLDRLVPFVRGSMLVVEAHTSR